MKRTIGVLALLLLVSAGASRATDTTAQLVFAQLQSLAGDWTPAKPGSKTVVHIEPIANGSSLIETWTMSPTRKSLTVYTLDGDRLLATHYCPQGNAPRLAWTETDRTNTHHFLFVDGANLQDTTRAHEHAFWIRLDSPDRFTRGDTYIANGARYDTVRDTAEVIAFVRMVGATPTGDSKAAAGVR